MTPLGGEIARGRYPVKRGGAEDGRRRGGGRRGLRVDLHGADLARAPLGPRDTPLITAGEAWAQVLRE